jgi:N-acetylmuramoyl-L-alanine amidase
VSLDVAIVVGHHRVVKGAVAVDGVAEFDWNLRLALQIPRELELLGRRGAVMFRPSNGLYSAQMKAVAEQVRAHGARCALELHFNSVELKPGVPGPQRTTVLYWPGSSRGARLAEIAAGEIGDAIGGPERTRAFRPQATSWAGAPLYFLELTHCPAVILEPHFGCTAEDHEAATAARDDGRLAAAIARAVHRFLE